MEDFIKRLEQEIEEVDEFNKKLWERLNKLKDFINSKDFEKLSNQQQSLLRAQFVRMEQVDSDLWHYLNILENRIATIKRGW